MNPLQQPGHFLLLLNSLSYLPGFCPSFLIEKIVRWPFRINHRKREKQAEKLPGSFVLLQKATSPVGQRESQCRGLPQQKYYRLDLLNTRHLFLTVLKAAKSNIKELANLMSDESLLLSSEMVIFLLCPHMAEGMRKLSDVSFIRTLIPFNGQQGGQTNQS